MGLEAGNCPSAAKVCGPEPGWNMLSELGCADNRISLPGRLHAARPNGSDRNVALRTLGSPGSPTGPRSPHSRTMFPCICALACLHRAAVPHMRPQPVQTEPPLVSGKPEPDIYSPVRRPVSNFSFSQCRPGGLFQSAPSPVVLAPVYSSLRFCRFIFLHSNSSSH